MDGREEKGGGAVIVGILLIILAVWGIWNLFFKADWAIVRNYGSAPDTAILQDDEKFRNAEACMEKANYLSNMKRDDGAWYVCGRKCKQEGVSVVCDEFKR